MGLLKCGVARWSAAATLISTCLFFLAGCSDARQEEARSSGSQASRCSICHGSASSAAPPNDTAARTSTSEITVGAHQAHLRARLSSALTCSNCHVVPATVTQPGHILGAPARIVFNGASYWDGAAASWNRAAATCTTYCHGATMAGGTHTQPVWTKVDGTQKTCTSCHGFPPPSPHPASSGCHLCHGDVVDENENISHPEKHIDGTVSSVADTPTKACTDCHTSKAAPATVRTQHPTDTTDAVKLREGCLGCHDLGTHMSGGNLRMLLPNDTILAVDRTNPSQIDTYCRSCHLGSGRGMLGKAPPSIPGYLSPTGDFHGTRAGAGFGGTLKAPYVRGQGPIACSACHDSHFSENGYLFAATVNGTSIPRVPIPRTGIGAEVLCTSCHLGSYHAACISCHGFDPRPPGTACFTCHRHDGIINYPEPTGSHANNTGNCTHCHSPWLVTNTTAPVINPNSIAIRTVTASSAKIIWTTDQPSRSFVDYGPGTPIFRAGTTALVLDHSVTLTGLTEQTTYTFRVRSENNLRSFVESALANFTTARADGPAAPIVINTADQWYDPDPVPMTMAWNPVSIANGNPIQYRLVVATNSNFTNLIVDTGWIANTSYTQLFPEGQYFWRVMARDSLNPTHESPWSDPDPFGVFWGGW